MAAATPEPSDGRAAARLLAEASPAEVRAALVSEEAAEFERDWREAMVRAVETLDLSEVVEIVESWRLVAQLTVAAGPEAHRAMYCRAAARLGGQEVPHGEPLLRTKARLGL